MAFADNKIVGDYAKEVSGGDLDDYINMSLAEWASSLDMHMTSLAKEVAMAEGLEGNDYHEEADRIFRDMAETLSSAIKKWAEEGIDDPDEDESLKE